MIKLLRLSRSLKRKQTQNNNNQEITVTVYRAPVNGEEYLLPEKVTRKAGAMTAPEIALDILVNSSPQDTTKMVSLFPKGTKNQNNEDRRWGLLMLIFPRK